MTAVNLLTTTIKRTESTRMTSQPAIPINEQTLKIIHQAIENAKQGITGERFDPNKYRALWEEEEMGTNRLKPPLQQTVMLDWRL